MVIGGIPVSGWFPFIRGRYRDFISYPEYIGVTVETSSSKTVFLGDVAITVWSYAFEIDQNSYVVLTYTDTLGNVTTLNSAVWSISGLGNPVASTITYLRSGSPTAGGTSATSMSKGGIFLRCQHRCRLLATVKNEIQIAPRGSAPPLQLDPHRNPVRRCPHRPVRAIHQTSSLQRTNILLHASKMPPQMTRERGDRWLRLGMQMPQQPVPLPGHDRGQPLPGLERQHPLRFDGLATLRSLPRGPERRQIVLEAAAHAHFNVVSHSRLPRFVVPQRRPRSQPVICPPT
jgi:hypothetical protein